jgi:hypothetical protein
VSLNATLTGPACLLSRRIRDAPQLDLINATFVVPPSEFQVSVSAETCQVMWLPCFRHAQRVTDQRIPWLVLHGGANKQAPRRAACALSAWTFAINAQRASAAFSRRPMSAFLFAQYFTLWTLAVTTEVTQISEAAQVLKSTTSKLQVGAHAGLIWCF